MLREPNPPTARKEKKLDTLFRPRSVAIIGASAKELSIGNVIIKNLVGYGFTGKIYPVNPKEKEIRGIKAYASITEIPGEVDLAHVIIPAPLVPQAIEDCGKKGVGSVIINSAGFSEMGEEGRQLQEAFLANARKYGVRIFGPNCQGIINCDPEFRAYCDFTFTFPEPGSVSVVALSGGVGAIIMQSLFDLGIGMRMYASNGNACDVSINEVLEYYGEDEGTKAVVLYTEGLKDQKAFLEIAAKVGAKKPILAMKAGRTEAGAKAAASHTGALAGVDISTDLLFEKAGIVSFSSEEEMCQAAMAFSTQPVPAGNRVGIITNTGGPAVIATDALVGEGLVIPPLSAAALEKLSAAQLPEATLGNPVDVVATGGAAQFRNALETLMAEEHIDAVFVNFVTAPFTDTDAVAKEIVAAGRRRNKPVICNFMTNLAVERFRETARILKEGGVPCYAFPSTAARVLGAMYRYHRLRSRKHSAPESFTDVDAVSARAVLSEARRQGRHFLSARQAYTVLSFYNIPVADWSVAGGADDAVAAAELMGYPVAVKADSSLLVHKSDAGGVAVNLHSADEVAGAVIRMKKKFPFEDLSFLVQKFLPGGKELIGGASLHGEAGHLVMLGLGGTYVEVFRDVTFRIAPVSADEARGMVSSLKSARLLQGVRGERPVDINAVTNIIQRLSQMVTDLPEIAETDLNPIMAFENGAVVVDARIGIHTEK